MSIESSSAYPVQVSASMPKRFERVQVLLRIGIWFVLGWLSQAVLSILFFGGPIITAALIAQNGGAEFHKRHGATYAKVVRFLTQFQGYMLVGTDALPSWDKPGPIDYECKFTGEPTIGSALLRFIMVIPQAIALAVVGFVAILLAVVAAIMVLVNESVGREIWRFQLGVVAWQARVISYYLSLVEEYPPFSLAVNELDETQEAGN